MAETKQCKKCKEGRNRAGACATCAGSGWVFVRQEGDRLVVTPAPAPGKAVKR